MRELEEDFFGASSRTSLDREKIIKKSLIGGRISKDFMDFGYDYFDNLNHSLGYHGYKYDGRFSTPVERFIDFYKLEPGFKILEPGCAKGYVLIEFQKRDMVVTGLDLSSYAVENCHEDLKTLIQGSVTNIPFLDKYFDFLLIKEMLPHLFIGDIELAIKECMRVTKGCCFFEIESGLTNQELESMSLWDPTHRICKTPDWWRELLNGLNYFGDVHFKFPWKV
jgi:ubiquinone/menaquinone biosynthesis C-methylase UbiE